MQPDSLRDMAFWKIQNAITCYSPRSQGLCICVPFCEYRVVCAHPCIFQVCECVRCVCDKAERDLNELDT